nr:hypothetical protein CFP56_43954 [Quercus suber]
MGFNGGGLRVSLSVDGGRLGVVDHWLCHLQSPLRPISGSKVQGTTGQLPPALPIAGKTRFDFYSLLEKQLKVSGFIFDES